ncbi:hypothetical protein PIB30_034004 [Stylosanthes scabra]|uniref:Uncharacterized protein n=1 Tax=Stylosanthes scabra TaxID=79078 RepID=A0ABU6UBF1_9FABA|nr:hypothetical protein [Stylosanthes scabra]
MSHDSHKAQRRFSEGLRVYIGDLFRGQVVGKVYRQQVVAEDGGWTGTRLTQFEEKILDPLEFSEGGGEGMIFCLRGATSNRGLLGALPGDEVGTIQDTVATCGFYVV